MSPVIAEHTRGLFPLIAASLLPSGDHATALVFPLWLKRKRVCSPVFRFHIVTLSLSSAEARRAPDASHASVLTPWPFVPKRASSLLRDGTFSPAGSTSRTGTRTRLPVCASHTCTASSV